MPLKGRLRELVVGANHGGFKAAVLPEPKRRTLRSVELFRAGCVSAGNILFHEGHLPKDRCKLSGTAGCVSQLVSRNHLETGFIFTGGETNGAEHDWYAL